MIATETPRAVPAGAFAEATQHYEAGSLPEAEAACRQILHTQPDHARALHMLSLIAQQTGRYAISEAMVGKAISADPSVHTFHNTLGLAQLRRSKPVAAGASFQRALAMAPTDANVHLNLGAALIALGKPTEATACFQQALSLNGDFHGAHSNVIFSLHYLPTADRQTVFAATKAWAERYAAPFAQDIPPHTNDRDPERRLRIGYVSGDLHHHPVGHVLGTVLGAHNKDELEIYCYSNNRHDDEITLRIYEYADHWRNIRGINDAQVADMIRADGIDILIDVSGHTAGNRLLVFARKPAPVQATWLGYFDTTGLSTMDYIIADRIVCPEGDDCFYTEKILRLPGAFLCLVPPDGTDAALTPERSCEVVNFGCFNNIAKINAEVIALWGQICRAVPAARIHIRSAAFGEASPSRAGYRAMFAAHGVTEDRVVLSARSSYNQYLADYADIDIALDPFPYNGGATTCEALWMGVPVVALEGDRFVSRMGSSILSAANCRELVAKSPDEYVSIAERLATDFQYRSRIRETLRHTVSESPLCDRARFIRGLEIAYREIWRGWCRRSITRT